MENTFGNRKAFETSDDIKISSYITYSGKVQADYVFFLINIKELFNVDLNYPGIKTALNKAFNESKVYVPVDSGLTKASYRMVQKSETNVECFFDPKKIIGKNRFGRTVDENYTIYIAENASRMNWLSIVQKHFLDSLYASMRELKKKQSDKIKKQKQAIAKGSTIAYIGAAISLSGMREFMSDFNKSYMEKKKAAREAKKREDEAKKNKELQLKALAVQNKKINILKEVYNK